ncbi:hypothetical protein BC835DRAFT_1416733 [Cytidiella melzeri]|nr:hypothetical protein BC835DRAFT_1416733 [Cytidiella melzeri]
MSSTTDATPTSTLDASGSESSGDGPSGYDISGLVIGVVSTAALLQLVYLGIEQLLPTKRLKFLDETLNETIELYTTVLEDGLFPSSDKMKSIEHRLQNLRRDSDSLRAKVHIATTFKRQIRAWWYGVSNRLNAVRREVEAARAEIALASDKERKRLERENRMPPHQSLSGSTYAASRATHAVPALRSLPLKSVVDPRLGKATGMGLHASQSTISTRAHVYPPGSGYHLSVPPPVFVPDPLPSNITAQTQSDARHRLDQLNHQLSRLPGGQGHADASTAHTPEYDDGRVHPSEIERTMKVLNELAKTLSVIAASELTSASSGPVNPDLGQVNPTQLGILIDGLRAVQAAAEEQPPAPANDVPSTATIEEVMDGPQSDGEAQGPPSMPLVDVS